MTEIPSANKQAFMPHPISLNICGTGTLSCSLPFPYTMPAKKSRSLGNAGPETLDHDGNEDIEQPRRSTRQTVQKQVVVPAVLGGLAGKSTKSPTLQVSWLYLTPTNRRCWHRKSGLSGLFHAREQKGRRLLWVSYLTHSLPPRNQMWTNHRKHRGQRKRIESLEIQVQDGWLALQVEDDRVVAQEKANAIIRRTSSAHKSNSEMYMEEADNSKDLGGTLENPELVGDEEEKGEDSSGAESAGEDEAIKDKEVCESYCARTAAHCILLTECA
ncbi:hypothetical protein BKA70DRAFT_1296466 [Coprinopsis sp. MPI-PUGE-AT-0042]|nr:hypothetical protein BKA70DRAFT_1296466 [Coprinopsis sp. MPI-PUGE-AT-0042]